MSEKFNYCTKCKREMWQMGKAVWRGQVVCQPCFKKLDREKKR